LKNLERRGNVLLWAKPGKMFKSAKSIGITVGHALVGWGLCGATMFGAMAVTYPARALIVHAVAAPFIFAGVSCVYFRRSNAWSPLSAAAAFLGVIVALDFLVVALFIEKSFEMFRSVTGTWLPFVLIFVATWCTGLAVRRQGHQE
jgi:hypothetical protein